VSSRINDRRNSDRCGAKSRIASLAGLSDLAVVHGTFQLTTKLASETTRPRDHEPLRRHKRVFACVVELLIRQELEKQRMFKRDGGRNSQFPAYRAGRRWFDSRATESERRYCGREAKVRPFPIEKDHERTMDDGLATALLAGALLARVRKTAADGGARRAWWRWRPTWAALAEHHVGAFFFSSSFLGELTWVALAASH